MVMFFSGMLSSEQLAHKNPMATERNVLQMPGFLAESRLLARSSFLKSILRLRTNVIQDLWNTVFPEFKETVLRRFHSHTFYGTSPQKYEIDSLEFLKTTNGRGDYLVHLLQRRLAPTQMDLNSPDPVRDELFSYVKAQQYGHNTLLVRIDEWSRRWNLNDEWCRNHALTVLRTWLFNHELRWVGDFPLRLQPIQVEGWRSASSDLESDAAFSRLLVELKVEAKGSPDPLKFHFQTKDGDFNFEVRWNIAEENEARFKKRVQAELKLSLLEADINRVKLLRQEDTANNLGVKVFGTRLTSTDLAQTVTYDFERHLKKYLSAMKAWKKEVKATDDLVEISDKPCIEHFEWLVLYQIAGEDGTCLTHSEITDMALERNDIHFTADSVRKTIAKLAKLIDLGLRDPHQHAGRPRGSRKQITHRATR